LDIPLFHGFLGYLKANEILFAVSNTSGAITVSHFFKEIQTEGTKKPLMEYNPAERLQGT
jgi:hypothetical protein